MKRKIKLMLSIFVAIAFIGCGGGSSDSGGNNNNGNVNNNGAGNNNNGGGNNNQNQGGQDQNNVFKLTSTDIVDGGVLGENYSANGANQSPALSWGSVPEGTKSFVITVYDPDAEFYHWAVYDIPPNVTSIARGASANLPAGAKEIPNDSGAQPYYGAQPPTGETHRYVFTVYAMNAHGDDVGDISFPDYLQTYTIAKSSITTRYTGK